MNANTIIDQSKIKFNAQEPPHDIKLQPGTPDDIKVMVKIVGIFSSLYNWIITLLIIILVVNVLFKKEFKNFLVEIINRCCQTSKIPVVSKTSVDILEQTSKEKPNLKEQLEKNESDQAEMQSRLQALRS